jgi:hypothetical protein
LLPYLEEQVAGELLDGEYVGDDGVGTELAEGDGADDGLGGEDGAAHQQHVRLLLAQGIQAPILSTFRTVSALASGTTGGKMGWLVGHLKKRIPWAEQ